MRDMWTYREDVAVKPAVELTDFGIEALDGAIGKVDESTADAGRASSSSTPVRGSSVGRCFSPPTRSTGSTWTRRRSSSTAPRKTSRTPPSSDPERGLDPRYQDELVAYYGRHYS